jgi:hypothetical protein
MKILTDNGNGLLDGIGYYQLYATRTGVLSTREREDLADRSPDVVYTDDDFVLDDVITTGGPNIHYNQIIAVVNDPERAPLYSVKTNSDPASVISTVSTGKTFTRQVNVEKAANQAALDKIARQYLREEANDLRHAKITTSLDPRRENHEVYEIHIEDLEETSEVWRAQSWRLPLQVGGKMTHEIRKVESLKLT